MTRVDKKMNYNIEDQEKIKAEELRNCEFTGKNTGERTSTKS